MAELTVEQEPGGHRPARGRSGCLVALAMFIALLAVEEWQFGIIRGILFFAQVSMEENSRRIPFNAADWRNPKLVWADDAIRVRMVDDLQSRYRLVGMSKKDVLKLLGKPDNIYPSGEWSYYLGWRSRYHIDPDAMNLMFDRQGRVKSVDVHET